MSEVVFILGAGASREAGAPLVADFLDRADELRKGLGEGSRFKEDFDSVFEAIYALQVVHSKARLDLYNIESVFAAFEMGRLTGGLPGFAPEQVKELLVSIRRVIFRTIESTVEFTLRDRWVHPDPCYDEFVKLLVDLNYGAEQTRCSIITFNYDLALDYALHINNVPVDYGLGANVDRCRVPLLKLHGSLNWARCSQCGAILPWSFDDYLSKDSRRLILSGSTTYHMYLASNLSSSGIRHCDKDIEPTPVIVPPTWNKTEYHQGLLSVWRHAAAELSDAENIFVSGYSLTETDRFFRYLFALGSVGPSLIKRLWVFGPDDDNVVLPRFEEMLGQAAMSRFGFWALPFRDLFFAVRADTELVKRNSR